MANQEVKIRFLGREYDPADVAAAGYFLTIGGALTAFVPSLAVPVMLVGMGIMTYGTDKMEQQSRQNPPNNLHGL